ncbi:unnamed protein product [Citrullus colocynthis]|uniref:Uncharacterized protein n=1 Tax=Citrullus colocynthis TaxID=252529 RepID=A0ABP0YTB5_9ROSI
MEISNPTVSTRLVETEPKLAGGIVNGSLPLNNDFQFSSFLRLFGPVLPPFRFLAFPNHFSLLHPSSSQGARDLRAGQLNQFDCTSFLADLVFDR